MRTTGSHLTSAARIGLAACVTAVLVAGCTSDSGESGSRDAAPTDRAIPSFTYAIATMPTSLSGITTKIQTRLITSLVTEPLERVSYVDGAIKYTPRLALAVQEPDPLTQVYTIRSGVKFSDGTPLTAEDVAWSMNAAAAPTAETAANLENFAGATATGPLQVTVKWKNPVIHPRLTGNVNVLQAKFAEAHSKDLGTPGALPIGTGPYMYEAQTSQDITLVPNPHYWGTRPKVETVKFTVISLDTSGQLAMRAGSIQGTRVIDLKTAAQWKEVPGASLHASRELASDLLSMDTSKPPFDDIHVRKAVAHSIDRKGILEAAFGGYADRLKTLVPVGEISSVAPSVDAAQSFVDRLPQYELDTQKAKQELAQSAFPDGFSVEVPYINTSVWEKLLLLNLQENMAPLGVTITLQPVPWGEWFQTFFSHQATGIQLLNEFSTPDPDPSGLLWGLVGEQTMKPNFPNGANFTTPAVEGAWPALNPATAAKFNRQQRWEATQTILTEVANQVPYVPLFSKQAVYVLADGYTFTQSPTFFDVNFGSWIDFLRSTR